MATDVAFQDDARRDVIALVRAGIAGDMDGWDAIMRASDDPLRLRAMIVSLCAGWASLLKDVYGQDADMVLDGVRLRFGQRADERAER